MAKPLPNGLQIWVEHKCLQESYDMPSMEMATDHYNIGMILSGDRKVLTPLGTYSTRAGDVAMMPPYVYHRTMAASKQPYERVMIKFSQEVAETFREKAGAQILDELYERRVCKFTEESEEKVRRLFFEIVEEFAKERPYREFLIQGMLYRLLLLVWEEMLPGEVEWHRAALTPPVMDAICYMEQTYAKDPSLAETAGKINFSAAYFSRLFHAQTGKSYSDYLDVIKLRNASVLLVQTEESVMEIAQETGYCHGNYFSEKFKRAYGMTPREYRKSFRQWKKDGG